MALFRLPSSGPAALAPRGNGLLLRAPQMSDFLQWRICANIAGTI